MNDSVFNPRMRYSIKEVAYIPRIRNLLLLMVMAIVIIDAKYLLLANESSQYIDDAEHRMLDSFTSNMFEVVMRRKRSLVLHVGPQNTGEDSIQATLSNEEREGLLRSDNYAYITPDVMKRSRSYQCNETITTGCSRTLSSDLIELLENEDKNLVASNALISDLDDSRRQAWVNATKETRDVTVVVDYVRLHELLRNRYNEVHAAKMADRKWPGRRGFYKPPPFSDYIEKMDDFKYHESVRTYKEWAKDFKVSIFNTHQEGDLATNFVCQETQGANHLCNKLTKQNQRKQDSKSLSPMYMDYDTLAVYAFEEGLIHENEKRLEVAQAIQDHHEKTNEYIPRACPTKNLRKIKRASTKFEQWALMNGASESDSDFDSNWADFDESWSMALENGHLCGVDPEAALEEEGWQDFFRLRYVQKSSQLYFG